MTPELQAARERLSADFKWMEDNLPQEVLDKYVEVVSRNGKTQVQHKPTIDDVRALEVEIYGRPLAQENDRYCTPWELLHDVGHWAIYPEDLRWIAVKQGARIPMYHFEHSIFGTGLEEELAKTWTCLVLEHKGWRHPDFRLDGASFPKAQSPTRPVVMRERELALLGIVFPQQLAATNHTLVSVLDQVLMRCAALEAVVAEVAPHRMPHTTQVHYHSS